MLKERQNRHDQPCPALGNRACTSYHPYDTQRMPTLIAYQGSLHPYVIYHRLLCAAVEVSTPTVVDLGCRLLYR